MDAAPPGRIARLCCCDVPKGSTKRSAFTRSIPVWGHPKRYARFPSKKSQKTANYLVVDDEQGLLCSDSVGNARALHVWGSREDNLEKPDRLIFDLDPDPGVAWPRVIEGARQIRKFLQQLGFESFVKTTGGKGLHLVVPIARRHEWLQVKAFCKQVADLVVQADPARYTANNMSKAARTKQDFLLTIFETSWRRDGRRGLFNTSSTECDGFDAHCVG